jgi:hypothetical protein
MHFFNGFDIFIFIMFIIPTRGNTKFHMMIALNLWFVFQIKITNKLLLIYFKKLIIHILIINFFDILNLIMVLVKNKKNSNQHWKWNIHWQV